MILFDQLCNLPYETHWWNRLSVDQILIGNLSFFGITWTFSLVMGGYFENGQKLPAKVEVVNKFGAVVMTVKTQLWRDLEDSLGVEFNTP
jgi:hypothetical protein